GFPLRLVVPGWYATYWVKMVTEIEVTNHPGTGFWMTPAYMVPDNRAGAMIPGEVGVKMVPISAMVPRSFINTVDKATAGKPVALKGFAFGGNSALTTVQISTDGGTTWHPARLGKNWGEYGAREWASSFTPPKAGTYRVMAKASNAAGLEQPMEGRWNPGGFMYNAIEHIDIQAS
ncbi:MAG: sulfide dehydrogenase, partial [Acidiphilium sp. 21-62-4]